MLSVGEVAKHTGVNVSALHFYEASGLIRSTRNAGNQRRYGRDVLRRVAVIKIAQRVGIALTEVEQAFRQLPAERTPTAADWSKLSARWQAELDSRIAALVLLRDQLGGCIDCGCLSLKTCPLRAGQGCAGASASAEPRAR